MDPELINYVHQHTHICRRIWRCGVGGCCIGLPSVHEIWVAHPMGRAIMGNYKAASSVFELFAKLMLVAPNKMIFLSPHPLPSLLIFSQLFVSEKGTGTNYKIFFKCLVLGNLHLKRKSSNDDSKPFLEGGKKYYS